MKTYRLHLSARSNVQGTICIEASSEDELQAKLWESLGDVSWHYDDVEDIEIDSIEPIN